MTLFRCEKIHFRLFDVAINYTFVFFTAGLDSLTTLIKSTRTEEEEEEELCRQILFIHVRSVHYYYHVACRTRRQRTESDAMNFPSE